MTHEKLIQGIKKRIAELYVKSKEQTEVVKSAKGPKGKHIAKLKWINDLIVVNENVLAIISGDNSYHNH